MKTNNILLTLGTQGLLDIEYIIDKNEDFPISIISIFSYKKDRYLTESEQVTFEEHWLTEVYNEICDEYGE